MSLTDKQVFEICGFGNGETCCRYLAMGPDGWRCLKCSAFRAMIDARSAAGQMAAKGDNCDGIPDGKPGSD
jgi:hypothetical protein